LLADVDKRVGRLETLTWGFGGLLVALIGAIIAVAVAK